MPNLEEKDLDPNPLQQFLVWYEEAQRVVAIQPTAMTLATATTDGRPSARMVLLKACDKRGFVFFTNFESRKGRELGANPHGALLFYWAELERQVRVEGTVEMVSPAESDVYFQSRPFESRLSATVSPQSRVIASRQELEHAWTDLQARHPDEILPRPAFWGGYRLVPDVFEFWQGGSHRLHDRFLYTSVGGKEWCIERLAP
jgi:pyridoxamine 5'-phosphate oxidase